MAERGGGDASVGLLPDLETLPSDTGSLSDSDSDPDVDADTQGPHAAHVAALSEEEEDEGPVEPPGAAPRSPVRPFHLRGTSSTFSLRSRSIFDGLEGAASLPGPGPAPRTPDSDATFKRPLPPPAPAARSGGPPVPDYVTHPERWTRYSLEDVPEGSDHSNLAAALEFLGDLKKRSGGSPAPQDACAPSFNQDPSSRGAGRIVFTKPAKSGERKRPPGRPEPGDAREPGEEPVALGHLGSAGGPEGEEPARQGGAEDPPTDSGGAASVSFHGGRKRSREHLRPKGATEEENEEA